MMELSISKLSKSLLNVAGFSVIILVAAVTILEKRNSDLLLVLAGLCTAVPLLYILFMNASDHDRPLLLFSL